MAFYVLDDRVIAAAGMGPDAGMIYIAELLGQGQMPAPAHLREPLAWENS